MDEQFWQTRWSEGRTAFHEVAPNPLLTRFLPQLELHDSAHVFVPLCGKTVDLDWLLEQGFKVSGIEFNRGAVDAVFDRLSLTPEVSETHSLTRFRSADLTLWQGDFFKLDEAALGKVDAVYDRAALVALPEETRATYSRHLIKVTNSARQLLIGFDYDQSQTEGPPFSVAGEEIATHYADSYRIDKLDSRPISGSLAQRCAGAEETWRLLPM